MATRRITTLLAAAVLLATVLLAGLSTAAPVSAADPATDGSVTASAEGSLAATPPYPYTNCPQWRFCFWDGLGATGAMGSWGGTLSCGSTYDFRGTSWENKISSIYNRTSGTVVLQNRAPDNSGWVTVWTSPRDNWGYLPPEAQNNTDRLVFVC